MFVFSKPHHQTCSMNTPTFTPAGAGGQRKQERTHDPDKQKKMKPVMQHCTKKCSAERCCCASVCAQAECESQLASTCKCTFYFPAALRVWGSLETLKQNTIYNVASHTHTHPVTASILLKLINLSPKKTDVCVLGGSDFTGQYGSSNTRQLPLSPLGFWTKTKPGIKRNLSGPFFLVSGKKYISTFPQSSKKI